MDWEWQYTKETDKDAYEKVHTFEYVSWLESKLDTLRMLIDNSKKGDD